MAEAIPTNQLTASQAVIGNDLLSQIIKLGVENKLLLINKVIDYIAMFEPQMDKSVREHLGFGDTAVDKLKFTTTEGDGPGSSSIGEFDGPFVFFGNSIKGRGLIVQCWAEIDIGYFEQGRLTTGNYIQISNSLF